MLNPTTETVKNENSSDNKKNIIQKNFVDNNDGFCPCELVKTPDTKCPCKAFRTQTEIGECHCGLLCKVEKGEE